MSIGTFFDESFHFSDEFIFEIDCNIFQIYVLSDECIGGNVYPMNSLGLAPFGVHAISSHCVSYRLVVRRPN